MKMLDHPNIMKLYESMNPFEVGMGRPRANPGTACVQFRRRPLREARCPRGLLVWVVLVLGTIGELPSMLHHFMFHAL